MSIIKTTILHSLLFGISLSTENNHELTEEEVRSLLKQHSKNMFGMMVADQENSPLNKNRRSRKIRNFSTTKDNNYFGPRNSFNNLRGPRGPPGLPGPACNLTEIENHILKKLRINSGGNIQYQASPTPSLVKLKSQKPIIVEKRKITYSVHNKH